MTPLPKVADQRQTTGRLTIDAVCRIKVTDKRLVTVTKNVTGSRAVREQTSEGRLRLSPSCRQHRDIASASMGAAPHELFEAGFVLRNFIWLGQGRRSWTLGEQSHLDTRANRDDQATPILIRTMSLKHAFTVSLDFQERPRGLACAERWRKAACAPRRSSQG
jgi:hypothetical protein